MAFEGVNLFSADVVLELEEDILCIELLWSAPPPSTDDVCGAGAGGLFCVSLRFLHDPDLHFVHAVLEGRRRGY